MMANDELKKKIVRILIDTDNYIVEKIKEAVENNTCFLTKENEYYDIVSDALIAAGLRFGDNLTATFDHIALEREHELERRLAEAERHAEVAARMAKRACDIVFSQEIESEEWDEAIFNYKKDKGIREIGITPNILYDYLKAQAEKELAEERKDD